MESESAELDPKGIIHEADTAAARDAVRLPMDAESVQMGVTPAHRCPETGVKRPDADVAAHQQTPPNQWTDVAEHSSKLVDTGHDRILMA
jgi:hypothetical protein